MEIGCIIILFVIVEFHLETLKLVTALSETLTAVDTQ
jgi:hypothetical protein